MLLQNAHIVDGHAAVHGLAHVIDGQQAHLDRGAGRALLTLLNGFSHSRWSEQHERVHRFAGDGLDWQLALLAPTPALAAATGLPLERRLGLRNGGIAVELFVGPIA